MAIRKMKNKKKGNIHLGIAWYESAEAFNNMKSVVSDKEIWEDTYDEWLDIATPKLSEFKKVGINPIRVNLIAANFIEWCKTENRKPDAAGRAAYISLQLENGYSENNPE